MRSEEAKPGKALTRFTRRRAVKTSSRAVKSDEESVTRMGEAKPVSRLPGFTLDHPLTARSFLQPRDDLPLMRKRFLPMRTEKAKPVRGLPGLTPELLIKWRDHLVTTHDLVMMRRGRPKLIRALPGFALGLLIRGSDLPVTTREPIATNADLVMRRSERPKPIRALSGFATQVVSRGNRVLINGTALVTMWSRFIAGEDGINVRISAIPVQSNEQELAATKDERAGI